MNVYFDFIIPAFERHVTISLHSFWGLLSSVPKTQTGWACNNCPKMYFYVQNLAGSLSPLLGTRHADTFRKMAKFEDTHCRKENDFKTCFITVYMNLITTLPLKRRKAFVVAIVNTVLSPNSMAQDMVLLQPSICWAQIFLLPLSL
jgi:hypothetical protein